MSVEQKQAVAVEQLTTTTERLSGRWLMFTRIVWAAIALLALSLLVASYASFFAFEHKLCTDALATCRDNDQVAPDDLRTLQALGLSLDFFVIYNLSVAVVFAAVYMTIGAVIFWRKSDDRLAFIASLTLITFPASVSHNLLATLPSVWALPSLFLVFLGEITLFLFFYLFPSGRFVPRWTRWLGVVVIIYWVLNNIFPFHPSLANDVDNIVLLGFIGSIPVVQVYRYRRVSNVVQRQQTKWVIFGISIGVGSFLAASIILPFLPWLTSEVLLSNMITSTTVGFLILIPLSIGIAILRSRLFDIDIIINRTLVYGALTISVVGLYVLVVGGLGALLQAQGNLLLSLVATGLIALLFQPLRTRLQRGVNRLMYGERDDPYGIISRLGTRLEATLVPDAILPTIVETVAQALKLPYAAIELKEGEQMRLAASYGAAMSPSLRVPLLYQQEAIGSLLLAARSPGETFTRADQRLLNDLAHQAGIAAHTVRLTADLVESRERLLLAREEERRRLARELHDSVSQALYGISLGAHTARKALEIDPAQVTEPLDYVLSLAEAALAEMRALIFELRPESLETEGLVAALTKQAAALRARQAIVVSTELCDEPGLSLQAKQELYRIAQEAMHNTVKHARASQVDLRLSQTSEAVLLEVRDDGAGFDTTAAFPGHLGLHSMRERVASLGGTFQIESAPGQGTAIRAHLPIQAAAD